MSLPEKPRNLPRGVVTYSIRNSGLRPSRPLFPMSLLSSKAARWMVRLTTALRSPMTRPAAATTQAVIIPFPVLTQDTPPASTALSVSTAPSAAPSNLKMPRYWEGGQYA